MNALKKKLGKTGGFTLVEMLIVVAIIAILIAISIPLVNSALERSRHAVDQANERDAIALATIECLTTENFDGGTYAYHVNGEHQGSLQSSNYEAVEAECTCGKYDGFLWVNVTKDGVVTLKWGDSASSAPDFGTGSTDSTSSSSSGG